MSLRRLVGLAASFVILISPFGTTVSAQGKITVGRNVMVSSEKAGWEHSEYAADGDPNNPGRVMVCSMRFSQEENRLNTTLYTTANGGKTWQIALDDSTSRFNGVWDPACAYGLNGQALFITLILPDTATVDSTEYKNHQWWRMGGDHNMHVYRSPDGGRTWEPTVYLSFIDAETITVDHSQSRFRGRMYIYGNTRGSGMWLVYSVDSGKTWQRSERTDFDAGWPRAGVVTQKGTLLVPVSLSGPEHPSGGTGVMASRDGGVHLDKPVRVSAGSGSCGGNPVMALDRSSGPFAGRVYLVHGTIYRGRCVAHVTWSDDDGKTWSPSVKAGDSRPRPVGERAGLDQIRAQLEVNPSGVLGITWYDMSFDPKHPNTQMRFTASLDGGETWLPSVQVSDFGYIPHLTGQAVARGGGTRRLKVKEDEAEMWVWPSARANHTWNSWPGDYTGMAVDADGAFHAFWIDNRSGVGEMYTSRITVEGAVAKPDAEVAGLTNITSAIEAQYTSSVWDPKDRTITLQLQLLNTSSDTIVGPLKLRFTQLESDLGAPALLLGQGKTGRKGTVLDVSELLPPAGLPPGGTSRSTRLVVRLDEVRDILDNSQRDMLHLKVKLYGTRKGPGKK